MKTCVRCNVRFRLTEVSWLDLHPESPEPISPSVMWYAERCPKCGGAVYERCA